MDLKTIIAVIAGAVIAQGYATIHKHLFDTKRVTKAECDTRHRLEQISCEACKKEIKDEACAFRHEVSQVKGLLLLMAVKIGVPEDKLQELVR